MDWVRQGGRTFVAAAIRSIPSPSFAVIDLARIAAVIITPEP
jgi:hypothetical protein